MKIVCINNYIYKNLTLGKTYDVINISTTDEYYYIIDDYDGWLYPKWYPKIYFKPLSEIRNDKINKLLEE